MKCLYRRSVVDEMSVYTSCRDTLSNMAVTTHSSENSDFQGSIFNDLFSGIYL